LLPKLRKLISDKPDTIATAILVLLVSVAVAYEYSYYGVLFIALYLFSLGTIIYNGIKLYGFFKRVAIEKSYKIAYAEFFSIGTLLYLLISTGVVVVLCFTIFAGEPNIYLLITSIFVVIAVAVYDLIKR